MPTSAGDRDRISHNRTEYLYNAVPDPFMKTPMHPAIQSFRMLLSCFMATTIVLLASLGCTKTAPATTDAPTQEAIPGLPPEPTEQFVVREQAEPIPSDETGTGNRSTPMAPGQPFQPLGLGPDAFAQPRVETKSRNLGPTSTDPQQALSEQIETPQPEKPQPEAPRQLPGDLAPDQLVSFLARADQDMQLIHSNRSGIEDPREARETLIKIVDLKLQASRQLSRHPDSSPAQQSEGNRGELQSLSHLAALSNVKAAEELQTLAESNMSSGDPKLVADSRLVLIGFAIESLQNGDDKAAENIVEYADQIATSDSAADIPALVVMGQAKQILENYGHAELGNKIRDTIIENFASSKNPDVASMAAQFVGNVIFDEVDELRVLILQGKLVTRDQWIASVETLIDESADIQTVSYLAGAAVDFEANAKPTFADATLQTLKARFAEPGAATTREVQTAIEATRARQEIIGQPFDPDLPSVSGSRLSLQEYRGKVVLIPFWGMGIPLSLQPIPVLQALKENNADQVAIVGVNLDSEDAAVQTFSEENKIGFPSFRLASDPSSSIPRDFGMVSMPFVVILDTEGKVAAIQLSENGLQQNIQSLLPSPVLPSP